MSLISKLWAGSGTKNNFSATPYQTDPNLYAANAANAQQGQQNYAAASGEQSQLNNLLMGQANGTAPSIAQAQLQQNTERNIGNQMALAAGARGGNPALAAYTGATNAGNMAQTGASNAALAGIQEREAAAQAAGGVQANQANEALGLAGMGTQGQLTQEQINAQQSLGSQQINAGVAGQNVNQATGLISGATGLVSGLTGGIGIGGKAQGGTVPGEPSPATTPPAIHALDVGRTYNSLMGPHGFGSDDESAARHVGRMAPEEKANWIRLTAPAAATPTPNPFGSPDMPDADGGYMTSTHTGAAQGAVIGGPESPVDNQMVPLRGGELVIPKESPIYESALKAWLASKGAGTVDAGVGRNTALMGRG